MKLIKPKEKRIDLSGLRIDIILQKGFGSEVYTRIKKKKAEKAGADVHIHEFKENASKEEFLDKIRELNKVSDGIIVQLPLKNRKWEREIIDTLDPSKDIDCLTTENLGKLFYGSDLLPPTVQAIVDTLQDNKIEIKGKTVAIFGQGILIGKPLSVVLQNLGATVVSMNSKTPEKIRGKTIVISDILVYATGKPNWVGEEIERKIVIDTGSFKIDGTIVGEVKREVYDLAKAITPVPGGIGPATVNRLLWNLSRLRNVQN